MMVKKIEEKTERRRRERLKKKIRKNSKKKENCKTEEPQDRGGAEKSGSGNLIVESGADLTF